MDLTGPLEHICSSTASHQRLQKSPRQGTSGFLNSRSRCSAITNTRGRVFQHGPVNSVSTLLCSCGRHQFKRFQKWYMIWKLKSQQKRSAVSTCSHKALHHPTHLNYSEYFAIPFVNKKVKRIPFICQNIY